MPDGNTVLETILSRRSIRSYTSEPVSPSLVAKLLEAAMAAPSARHQEPWHFIVIDSRTVLDEIPRLHPHAKMVAQAPLAILVCFDAKLETAEGFAPVDCGNATMNLLHAANALGLGAVWVGVYPNEGYAAPLRLLLKIPDGIRPFALVPIGHPAERKGKENRYKGERVHHNQW